MYYKATNTVQLNRMNPVPCIAISVLVSQCVDIEFINQLELG